MFNAYYDKKRFKFIHHDLLGSDLVKNYHDTTLIPKTGVFIGDNINLYIDTSDGVNEDLQIHEYCGRIKRVVNDCKGKPFLFFKSAYSDKWTKKIEKIAKNNNGKVIPFFKWSFNENFYQNLLGNRKKIVEKYRVEKKEFDIGVFFHEKPYCYPKPSEFDNDISFSDHQKFNIVGNSRKTGYYDIHSRKNLIKKLKNSDFKVLHSGTSFNEYIKNSFKCKVIINPPGIGEYTSRMVDQTYLGNCIVLRKNSYDNGLSWKPYIPEINFKSENWKKDMAHIIENYDLHAEKCKNYYENFWNPESIVNYLIGKTEKWMKILTLKT